MSSGTLRSRLVVFIGLAAVGVLVPVATASGKPKHHKVNLGPIVIRSTTVAAAGHTVTSADAHCPKGSAVTGGGFETSVPSDNGPFAFESYRPDNRTWRASVGSGPDAKDASVTAYAVCRRGAPNLVPIYAAAQVPLFNPPVIGAVDIGAACPPGWRAVAGGFRGEVDINSGAALPQSSQRTDKRTWTNTAFAIGSEDGPPLRHFTSIAYCARKGRAPVSATAPVESLDPNRDPDAEPTPTLAQAVAPDCRRGALSGGFAASPIVNSIVAVVASKPVSRGWQATGAMLGGDAPGSITASGYCGR
jgi:hypothetical protein